MKAKAILWVVVVCSLAAAGCSGRKPAGESEAAKPSAGGTPSDEVAAVAWGEAVNGLQIGLEPARRELPPGQPIALRLHVRNVSGRPLPPVYTRPPHLWDASVKGEGAECVQRPPGPGPLVSDFFETVAPGETRVIDTGLSRLGAGRTWKITKPGRYEVRVSYIVKERQLWDKAYLEWIRSATGRQVPGDIWHGTVTTGAVEIEITAKGAAKEASAAFVERGLSVTVKPAKNAFRPKEPLAFNVAFKNVSKKPFMLFDVDFYPWWRYKFTEIGGEESGLRWDGFCIAKYRRKPPDPVELAPGKTRVVGAVLDHKFMYGHPGARGTDTSKNLPPGKYRVSVEIRLAEPKGWALAGKPAEAAPPKWPFWTGTITTRPVGFEITAKGGAGE